MPNFLDSASLMPHGMCLLWRTDLLALHVVSDAVIALAYFSIPLVLLAFVRRRPTLGHRGVVMMFAAFILLCGATHVVSIWTFWFPDYALQGLLKGVTAGVSLATALALWPLLPKLLALPSPSEVSAANEQLAAEVVQRRDAERRYRNLAQELEEQVNDRTERLRESVEAHAASEARFRAAFDGARLGLMMGSLDGPWTAVNRAFCAMLGYEPGELLELNWPGVTHPEDLDATRTQAQELLAGRCDSWSMTKRFVRRDGETVHVMVHVTLVRDERGEPQFFFSQAQDLTEVFELEAAARKSEARATMLIEGASDAIFEIDGGGRIRSSNQAARVLLGRDENGLEGRELSNLFSREDGLPLNWQTLLAHGHAPRTSNSDTPLLAEHASGQRVPVELRIGSVNTEGEMRYSAIVRDVSERVSAETALRRAHEALRFHMANSPLAVIEWNERFEIIDWSPSAEAIFGFRRDEVVNRHPSQFRFVHEDDAEKIGRIMQQLSDGSVARNRVINRNYRKDGTEIDAEWFNSVRLDAEGNVLSILSFVEDVSERVQASRALMRSEAHTKAILDTAVDGIISIEPDGTVLSINPAAERIFGYPSSEVVGHNIKMLMPEPYRHEHDSYLHNYLSSGQRKIIGIGREVTGLRRDGQEFPMELSVSEVQSEGHRTFTGFVRDISDRKRFESEIVEGNRQLQEKDWLLSGHATLTTALQGNPTITEIGARASAFLCEYLGAQAATFYTVGAGNKPELVAQDASYGAVPSTPSDLVCQAAARQSTVTLNHAEEQPVVLRTSFGELSFARLLAFPIVHEGQTEAVIELGAVGQFHNEHLVFLEFVESSLAIAIASARGRERVRHLLKESQQQAVALEAQGEELKSANEHLREHGRSLETKNSELQAAKREIEDKARAVEQANRYKTEFLANMSHELRTPLNSMLVLSRTLADNHSGQLAEEDVEAARIINRSGQSLLTLINDILDLSKVEAGKLDIEPRVVDVAAFAADLFEQFRPIAASSDLDFRLKLPDAPGPIVTDPLRLEQILRNLLANAFKFTEHGGVELRFRECGEDGVEFEVVDTGIGISAERQQQIFDAFQQVDGSTRRRYEGTGLGLSISRELGRLLHADLRVTSEPGRGSRFVLRLPLEHPDYAPDVHDAAAPRADAIGPAPDQRVEHDAAQPSGTLTGRDVLVVDDDYRNSFALSRLLSDHGAAVTLADSGRQALEHLSNRSFDLVLLDVMMPEMSGVDVIRELERRGLCPDTPIIAITADVTPEIRAEMEAAGARACVLKPIDTALLIETLDHELHAAA